MISIIITAVVSSAATALVQAVAKWIVNRRKKGE